MTKQHFSTTPLLSIFIMLALSACSNQPNKFNKNPTPDNPVEISLWYNPSVSEAGQPPADWAGYKIILNELGIKLRLTPLSQSNEERTKAISEASALNNLPDMCVVGRDSLITLIHKQQIASVDDLYKLMPNRSAKMYNDASKKFATFNGKCYGFSTQSGAPEKNEGILIRKDWLDKLELPVPKTLDEYIHVMHEFTFKDPDGNGKDDTYGYGAFIEANATSEGLGRRFDPFFGAFGVAGTWNLSLQSPGLNIHNSKYFDALTAIKKIHEEGLIDPNWIAYKKDDFRNAWKSGRFGIMREQNAAYAAEANYAPFDKNFPNGSWIVIDPPAGPAGLSSVGVYSTPYTTLVISKKAADEGKAPLIAKLLEWMSSDKGYYLLGWGEEGVNFVFDANHIPTAEGIPDPSKSYAKTEQQPLIQLRNLIFYGSDAELISRYPTYTCAASGKTMSALSVLRQMETKSWTPNIGADTLPAAPALVKKAYEQGVLDFVTGKRALTQETWNAWLIQFDKLGGDAWEKAGYNWAVENNYLY